MSKQFITVDQAIALLPAGERVHTFRRAPGGLMLGCDWDRPDVLEAITKSPHCEIGGEACRAMKHGLVIWTDVHDDRGRPLFVECKQGTDYESLAQTV